MKSEETYKRIYAATLRLLEEHGPEAVTMRHVAKEAGLTTMATYYHFKDREDLLNQVVQTECDKLVLGDFSGLDTMRCCEDKICLAFGRYLTFAITRPNLFDYYYSSKFKNPRQSSDFLKDRAARIDTPLNRLITAVERRMEEGTFRHNDPVSVAFDLWMLVHGYVMLRRAGRLADLSDTQFRHVVTGALGRQMDGLREPNEKDPAGRKAIPGKQK